MSVYPQDFRADLPGSPYAPVAPPEADRFQRYADDFEAALGRLDRTLNALRAVDDDTVTALQASALGRALTAIEQAEVALRAVEEGR